MNREDLIKQILDKVPDQYDTLVYRAIKYATEIHKNKTRLNGEPLIDHLLRTANKAGELSLDTDSIIAALLHHALNSNYSETSLKIKQLFGNEVNEILEEIERISVVLDSDSNKQTIINYVMDTTTDLRPVMVKLCTVYDNSKSISSIPKTNANKSAFRVLDLYGPISEYLNLEELRREIEAKAFKYIDEQEFYHLSNTLKENAYDKKLISVYETELGRLLKMYKYRRIFGRFKGIYSLSKKMKKYEKEGRGSNLKDIYDVIAFSITTETKEDAYEIFSFFTREYELIPKRTCDYIANPKPNGFSGIQITTKIKSVANIFIEIQILTENMYYHNTYGPASHIAYKASLKRYVDPNDADAYKWFEGLQKNILEHTNKSQKERTIQISNPRTAYTIFVITPKGKVLELPKGATALDFAYKLHTNLGNSAISTKINGKERKLDTVLQIDDVIEIIKNSQKKYPSEKAIHMVTMESSKDKIYRKLREKETIL